MKNPRKQGINAPVGHFLDFQTLNCGLDLSPSPLFDIVRRDRFEEMISSQISSTVKASLFSPVLPRRSFWNSKNKGPLICGSMRKKRSNELLPHRILPDTRPGITLTKMVFVQPARTPRQEEVIDWDERGHQFREIVDRQRHVPDPMIVWCR